MAAKLEPDEIVLIEPCGSAKLRVRVYLKPEKQHCHAGRDGECNWVYCPQEKDGERIIEDLVDSFPTRPSSRRAARAKIAELRGPVSPFVNPGAC